MKISGNRETQLEYICDDDYYIPIIQTSAPILTDPNNLETHNGTLFKKSETLNCSVDLAAAGVVIKNSAGKEVTKNNWMNCIES